MTDKELKQEQYDQDVLDDALRGISKGQAVEIDDDIKGRMVKDIKDLKEGEVN